MSKIKFRAWDKKDKKFVSHREIQTQSIPVKPTKYGFKLKTVFVLNQFTGLYDKNKREIYEGDIVQVTETLIEVFEWVNSEAGFKTKRIDSKGRPVLSDPLPNWPHYEVIGNIYETPELLKDPCT